MVFGLIEQPSMSNQESALFEGNHLNTYEMVSYLILNFQPPLTYSEVRGK